jgi:hypothetical protein
MRHALAACSAPHMSSGHARSPVAPVLVMFKRPRGLVASGGVQIMLVVGCKPDFQRPDEGQGTGPLLPPEAFFFERPHDALGIRVTLRSVIAGEGVLNPQGAAGLHEGQRGWLAAVVSHQGHALVPSSRWKLAVDSHVQCRQPMPGGTGHTSVIPDDLVRVPIQHQHDLHPTDAFHPDLGHIEAPPS